VRGLLAD